MIKKLCLAAALIALPMMLSDKEASAGGFGFGYGVPGYGYGVARPPLPFSPYHSIHRSYSRVVAPFPGYGIRHPGIGYGYGYGRSCRPIGYGHGHHHHHHFRPVPRAGVSFHLGF